MNADLFAMQTARARRADPATSHTAAKRMNRSGRTGAQASQVMAAVRLWPGCTSAEIAQHMQADRVMPARRLPELAAADQVMRGASRPCNATGNASITWWPMPAAVTA